MLRRTEQALPRRALRWLLAGALLALVSACMPASRNPLAQWVPSPNHDQRRALLIVIHCTEQQSVAQSLDTLRTGNARGPVSAHYLIGKDGARFQLVEDARRAWHGGAGRWGNITDINSASIGIELDNDGRNPYPEAQIDSLLLLLEDLTARLRIPRTQVVAHADVAPARKTDPGPLFPWKRLAKAGFGIWPDEAAPPAPPGFDPWLALRAIGYPLDDPAAAVRAFHLRFRGHDGTALDAEDLRLLHALAPTPLPSDAPAPALDEVP